MVTNYILALMLLTAQPPSKPVLVSPHETRSSCMAEAEKMNKTDEDLRSPEARAVGAEYVCLKVERFST